MVLPLLLVLAFALAAVPVSAGQKPFTLSLDSFGDVGASWTLSSSGYASKAPVTSVAALVPGDVNDDLERVGLLPNLFYGDNSEEAAWWVPLQTWTYTGKFSLEEFGLTPGKWAASLYFDGVDYNATIVLNNVTLARHHAGSFLRIALANVHDILTVDNELIVQLHPPPQALAGMLYNATAALPSQMYGIDQDIVRTRPSLRSSPRALGRCLENRLFPLWKSRLNKWDFACKFWQLGIWRSVSLRFRPLVEVEIAQPPTVQRTSIDLERRTASVDVNVATARYGGDSTMMRYQVKLQVECTSNRSAPGGTATVELGQNAVDVNATISLADVQLWFPNGYGQQHLYLLRAEILSDDGRVIDWMNSTFGLRTLAEVDNQNNQYGYGTSCSPCVWNSTDYPRDDPNYPSPKKWLFVLNREKVFARGGNWVPADLAYGRASRDEVRLRALIRSAKLVGYNWFRVWGGGTVESRLFYDLCDEHGIMVQQDLPLAARHRSHAPVAALLPARVGKCGYAKVNGSYDYLSEPVPSAGGLSILDAWRDQIPRVLRQDGLVNHPSLVRYTTANEFYMNRTQNPLERAYEDLTRRTDPTRMVREADPTNVGQRHGPYHFDVAGGSGYDAYGGVWPFTSSCSSVNAASEACRNSRYSDHDGGPGDPFEWSEFGTNAISDIDTLAAVLPPASLSVESVGDGNWSVHKAGMWLDKGLWSSLFGKEMSSLAQVVRASQFVQAEAYRYAYQAGRRRKYHRSLMASWTFNEPWPNAAHGCIIDYYGRTKHAYYWVKKSMAMLDASLHYTDIHSRAGERINATLFIDSELRTSTTCNVSASYFYATSSDFVFTESFDSVRVPEKAAVKIANVTFVPPRAGIVIASIAASCAGGISSSNDYYFGIVADNDASEPLAGLLQAPSVRMELDAKVTGRQIVSMRVRVAGDAAAILVKPFLVDRSNLSVPFTIFDDAHVTVRDETTFTSTASNANATRACVEAWNAERVCVDL